MGLGLERVVYISRARGDGDNLLLQIDILATSQRNNDRDGLTGALLIHDGRFLQVLEGAGQDIDRVMRRLLDDPRHEELRVLERAPITHRRFGEWAMASARVTPGLAQLLARAVGVTRDLPETVDLMEQAVRKRSD